MKRLFLFLAAGSVSALAVGQEAHKSVVFSDNSQVAVGRQFAKSGFPDFSNRGKVQGAAAKTTSSTSRWIRYSALFDTLCQQEGSISAISTVPIWNDTLARVVYTSGVRHLTMSSVAMVLDPSNAKLNSYLNGFAGEMKIRTTDALMFDSVAVFGLYAFNPTKTTVTDTLRISTFAGNGAPSLSDNIYSGYSVSSTHYGTVKFLDVAYDSITNVASKSTTPYGTIGSETKTVLLDNSGTTPAWGDTLSNGLSLAMVGFTPIPVTAHGYIAASVSFKSGDPAFPTTLAASDMDTTANLVSGERKYNMWEPIVRFRTDLSGTTTEFATLDTMDKTVGLFKRLPNFSNGWGDTYVPMWAWSTNNGTGPSYLQYPEMWFHVTCATCSEIYDPTSVATIIDEAATMVVPNPANGQVTINAALNQASDVSVSLYNIVGQQVATQSQKAVMNVKATFNTANLPAGVYTYTIKADGQSSTGRVVIAH